MSPSFVGGCAKATAVNRQPLALASRSSVIAVTEGATVPTCTAAPLLTVLVVTVAVRLPTMPGVFEKVNTKLVGEADVTVPSPLLNATVLSQECCRIQNRQW